MAVGLHRVLRVGSLLALCRRGLSLFTCDGGATALEASKVNDNYCDCDDGADETRTPACSHIGHARFQCVATGPLNQTIPTSRLWDGVCDCCDGSDEHVSEFGGWDWTPPCDATECQRLLQDARAGAIAAYRRVKGGLDNRPNALAEGDRAVANWQKSSKTAQADKEALKSERKAVEKLQALLKVYLQDEERMERKERVKLAAGGACNPLHGTRRKAAALRSCEDDSEARLAAERVRTERAAARARRDLKRDAESAAEGTKKRKGKVTRDGDQKNRRSRGHGGDEGVAKTTAATADDILDLQWPLEGAASDDRAEDGSAGEQTRPETESPSGGVEVTGGRISTKDGGMLSLRAYVKQRQTGSGISGKAVKELSSGAATVTEEKQAEELRKTALLGPVLNDGERGVYLGLTILLRLGGLPIMGPLRGLFAACEFIRWQTATAMAAAVTWFGLPSLVRETLEAFGEKGVAGISPRLDFRRYPTLRSMAIAWHDFLEGNGKFLLVMWDAPVAVWDFIFPDRDEDYERPEAAMLREGIARAGASLRESDKTAGSRGRKDRRRQETGVKRLMDLDLGGNVGFAALAEACLDLREGGYLYSLCPFKEVKQDKISLGKWKRWGQKRGSSGHPSMVFEGGSRCHNRNQRWTEVFVECGPIAALVAAEELEIGVYRLTLETPLACTERDVQSWERRLAELEVPLEDALEEEQPQEREAKGHTSSSASADERDHSREEL